MKRHSHQRQRTRQRIQCVGRGRSKSQAGDCPSWNHRSARVVHQACRNLLLVGTRLKLHQSIRIGSVDDNLRHADLEPGHLGLRAGRNKCTDGGMCYLRGKLAFGQGERPVDDNDLLHLTALLMLSHQQWTDVEDQHLANRDESRLPIDAHAIWRCLQHGSTVRKHPGLPQNVGEHRAANATAATCA